MGNKNTTTSNEQSNAPSTLTAQQARTLQRLFSRGLHPDVSLLPYQMPRMKVDAPPQTKQNKKTIRMKNICYINKKTFGLKHMTDNKYKITFEYSTTLDVYCSIYLFVHEATDKYNCTIQMNEKYKRNVISFMETGTHDVDTKQDVKQAEDNKEELKSDAITVNTKIEYIGTTYLLSKGYNLTFEQIDKDYMDLNAVNYKFFQINPALNYYPLVIVLSLQKPKETLLCVQDINRHNNVRAQPLHSMDKESKEKIAKHNEETIQNGIEYVTKSIYYAKLILGSNNLYQTEIVSQKTQVKNRAFESQDIYGLDVPTDPYSQEENLCVICMTMPRDTALCPCRHLCLCSSCSQQLLQRSNKCPVCRGYVSETIKISRNSTKNVLLE